MTEIEQAVAPQAPQIGSENLAFVEAMYEQFLDDPTSVGSDWQALFAEWEDGTSAGTSPSFTTPSLFRAGGGTSGASPSSLEMQARQDRVDQLIRAYRVRGHMIAKLDPLGIERHDHPELHLSHYGLSERDLDEVFSTALQMQGSRDRRAPFQADIDEVGARGKIDLEVR